MQPQLCYFSVVYKICLFLNRFTCNRKKSSLKQDPKSTQAQNKFQRECHLFQNNIAVSQIKLIQQNSGEKRANTMSHDDSAA